MIQVLFSSVCDLKSRVSIFVVWQRYRTRYAHKRKIFAEGEIFEIFGHVHSAKIGMTIEDDTDHIVRLALVPVAASPYFTERWHMRIALLAAYLQKDALFRFVIAEIVGYFEAMLFLISVMTDNVDHLEKPEFALQASRNAKNLFAWNDSAFIAANIDLLKLEVRIFFFKSSNLNISHCEKDESDAGAFVRRSNPFVFR